MSVQPKRLVPRSCTTSYAICQSIHKYGEPVTMQQGIGLHGYKGAHKLSVMQGLYEKMVDNNFLYFTEGKYWLTLHVEKYFDGNSRVTVNQTLPNVLPRYNPPFKERRAIPRDERLRQISFVTADTIPEPVISGWSHK